MASEASCRVRSKETDTVADASWKRRWNRLEVLGDLGARGAGTGSLRMRSSVDFWCPRISLESGQCLGACSRWSCRRHRVAGTDLETALVASCLRDLASGGLQGSLLGTSHGRGRLLG